MAERPAAQDRLQAVVAGCSRSRQAAPPAADAATHRTRRSTRQETKLILTIVGLCLLISFGNTSRANSSSGSRTRARVLGSTDLLPIVRYDRGAGERSLDLGLVPTGRRTSKSVSPTSTPRPRGSRTGQPPARLFSGAALGRRASQGYASLWGRIALPIATFVSNRLVSPSRGR